MSCPIRNWAKEINRLFSIEDLGKAMKHMKNCSIPLITTKYKVKPQDTTTHTLKCYNQKNRLK